MAFKIFLYLYIIVYTFGYLETIKIYREMVKLHGEINDEFYCGERKKLFIQLIVESIIEFLNIIILGIILLDIIK